MKRVDLLTQETSAQEGAEFQAKQDLLQLEADLLETQKQLAQAEQELLHAKSAQQLSVSNIISIQDKIAGYEAGIKSIKALKKELF